MGGGAWWAAVHRVAKSQTRPSDLTFTFHFHALEKEMATHSSVLAWRIPGTEEPGWLPSMGSHRVGHEWSDLAAAAAVTSDTADDTTLMAESEEELKSLLMTVKEEWKSWLKLNIQKKEDHGTCSHYIMANRGNNRNSDRLYFLGLQKSLQMVTAAMKLKDACSLEEKLWPT